MYSFPNLEPVCCFMFSSNCCFLTGLLISQEAGQVAGIPISLKIFQFAVIHTVKGFGVNKAKVESDMTEQLHFHFSLSCIGEGNGNPLQYFCLENPRDKRVWWAAIYGVTQSGTRVKRLSSSSSSLYMLIPNS